MAAEEGKVDPMKQFAIEPMFGTGGFEVAGYNLAFTNSALWMLIATVLLWIFVAGGMKRQLVPGRWQMAVRLGLLKPFLTGKNTLAVAGVSVRYRKRVPIFQKYRMQTRMLGYGERFFYVDQTMWQGETCMNQMLLRAAIRDKSGTVPPADFLKHMGKPTEQPNLPDWVRAWSDADETRPWPPEIGPVFNN